MMTYHLSIAMLAAVGVLPAETRLVSAPGDTGKTVSVLDFGAKGDGTTDDTASVQAAAQAAAGGILVFPRRPAAYKITGTVTVPGNTRIKGDDCKILMALPPDHATGRLFYVTDDDVEVDGLSIDASGANPRATSNRYAIAIVGTAGLLVRHLPSYAEVANIAVFAASDWARTITASEINFTGGAVVD